VTKGAGVTVFEFGVTSIKQPPVFKGHLFVVPMVTSLDSFDYKMFFR
jgi:hypothetical protein